MEFSRTWRPLPHGSVRLGLKIFASFANAYSNYRDATELEVERKIPFSHATYGPNSTTAPGPFSAFPSQMHPISKSWTVARFHSAALTAVQLTGGSRARPGFHSLIMCTISRRAQNSLNISSLTKSEIMQADAGMWEQRRSYHSRPGHASSTGASK